jgi:HSP20 family protein
LPFCLWWNGKARFACKAIFCHFRERKSEKGDQKRKFHRIERSFGTFRRSFTLPEDADSTKVTAEFRDGVLKVHLPTAAIAKTKAIEVKVA